MKSLIEDDLLVSRSLITSAEILFPSKVWELELGGHQSIAPPFASHWDFWSLSTSLVSDPQAHLVLSVPRPGTALFLAVRSVLYKSGLEPAAPSLLRGHGFQLSQRTEAEMKILQS